MDLEQRALLPLVGRTRELDALLGAFDRASDGREPQLVTLVGAPGIGKSRLVAEFSRGLEAIWSMLSAADKFIVEQAPWNGVSVPGRDGYG